MAVDKLVDSAQLDTDLTSVANAIRTKGGTSAQLAFPAGFVDAIDAIETGGGGDPYDILKKYISNTAVDLVTIGGVTAINGTYVLGGWSNLKGIVMPDVTSISSGNFLYGANNLEKFVFPSLLSLGTDALRNLRGSGGGKCVMDFGQCASLGTRAIYSCYNKAFIFRKTDGICVASATSSIESINTGRPAYVPAALLSAYQNDTNWSTKASSILQLEGSPYEDPDWWKET